MLLYSYKPGSKGAKALSQELDIKRIKHEGSRFTGRRNPIVINWGASEMPDWSLNCRMINHAGDVGDSSNKLHLFESAPEGCMPPYATSKEEAVALLPVMCRTCLTGHSGAGIVYAETEQDLVDAPLYVKYIKKSEEYRVHIFRSQVIDVQRKIRRPEAEVTDWKVRSHQNGFIYARNNVNPARCVTETAREVFNSTDLDFGAVDVIYNRHQDRAYVLEINTAPGITGTTVKRYASMFRNL